ncbi:ABC transporter ATP-binding protein [Alicyclobacillus sp.]|uniref:ABC transporter ATP-binding protein n=1 Tax=Alicyclobacillus sp. TaxID=61169 RepID=UPI0025B8A672|nr:ABC transporter ATP-binding protein [Alicyclobacillus sp.]MCL6517903.1 ABC transporter ATP-binding protein/permease [Alicyclobacillus sp.]
MFSVLAKLAWFFRAHRGRYTIAVGLLFILNFVEIAPPKLIGDAIDWMSQGTLTEGRLVGVLALYVLVMGISYSMGYTWSYQLYGGSRILERTLRHRLMRHFLHMSPPFFEARRTGDLMALATNDVLAVSQTVGFGMLTLIDSTTFSATILVTMAVWTSWKLTLLSLIPLPVIATLVTQYGKVVHRRFTEAQNAFGEMNDQVLETVSGMRVLRAFATAAQDRERFQGVIDDVYEKNVSVARVDSLFDPTIKLLVGTSYLIGLGGGTYLVFRGELTIGQLTAFNVYLGMLIWPMLAIGELINIMQRGNASLDRIESALAHPADVEDAREPVWVEIPEEIRFDHVTFRYPTAGADNLRDVSLTVRRGETLGIVGRTGSGKTTLLRQLLREYPPGAGRVCINGVPLERIPFERLRGWIGYVPQEPTLFSRSIADNVRFGQPGATREDILRALDWAGFTDDLATLPEGLDTLVGERGVTLSGGQKQRIALARALVRDPEILLLDDALSAVDARTEARILDNIRRLRRGRTTLIATHRMPTVAHADRVVVLEDGRVAESGTPEDLLRQAGSWFREQYERQRAESDTAEAGEGADVPHPGEDGGGGPRQGFAAGGASVREQTGGEDG